MKILGLLFALFCSQGLAQTDSILGSGLATLSQDELRSSIEDLSGERDITTPQGPYRIHERGSYESRKQTALYIQHRFQDLGFEAKLLEIRERNSEGVNVEAILEGSAPSLTQLILSAHLDSVGNAGANDDASGIAALLAVARMFSDLRKAGHTPLHNIRFVAFDLEESGKTGSRLYTSNIKAAGLQVANIQMDMIGSPPRSSTQVSISDCHKQDSEALTHLILEAGRLYNIPLTRKFEQKCNERSDHANFWKQGYPAVQVFQGEFESCYHSVCDKMRNIDFSYLLKVTQLVAASAYRYSWQP